MQPIIQSLLNTSKYLTLSTRDKAGMPWAAPLWFVHDSDLNLYWWSPKDAQHSQNIAQSNDVYITIFNSNAAEGEGSGLYIRARAQQLENADVDKICQLYNDSTVHYKLNPRNCTGDAPTRLYKATPLTMWVNDELIENGFYTDVRKELGY